VKSFGKPSISAWAVNQLYWKHREPFDRLIAAGERFGRASASQAAGKAAGMRALLAARSESLSHLSRLAESLLRDAGHNPTPDTMRRIATTLEALSIYSLLSDAPAAGRLTGDVDPPGFESLAALIPTAGRAERFDKPVNAASSSASRQARIASAKAALQAAEKHRREVEERFKKAGVAAEEARRHLHSMEADAEKAARELADAERAVEEARKKLKE
jgi:hypothetical protein